MSEALLDVIRYIVVFLYGIYTGVSLMDWE